jgi:Zn-dependent peptidase ImmA (M78 family)
MPAVNPNILTWARETAGLSLEDAAHQIKLNAARGVSGADRLKAIEQGQDEPTRALLQRMAERYRRPLVAFYLPNAPATGDRGEDFRRPPGAPPLDYDPRLDALLRDLRNRHAIVRTLLEDEEARPLTFIGSLRSLAGSRNAAAIADAIATTIGFQLQEYRRANNARTAFAYLRSRLEVAGIFVLLLGNLGSYHTAIPSTAFRGYAISDSLAPFIIINENDNDTSWAFTALHEACHLWLGQSGISGASHATRVEQLCNDVAGRILMPRADVQRLAYLAGQSFQIVLDAISDAARNLNVSRRMVAYQLLRADIIDVGMYQTLCDRFRDDWLHSRTRDAEAPREETAVSYYTVRRHRLGPALVALARRAVSGGDLPPTRAARLLGVKPTSVHPLLNPA